MSNLPVFIDGPLKGRADIPVDAFTCSNGMWWQSAPEPEPVDALTITGWKYPEPVRYRFRHVAMFSHTVLVGSVADPPSAEAMLEALCSDQAKASARWRG